MLESEVIKPLVLCLLDPEQPPIPDAQFVKALDVVESWMVRRMLVRATTKNYNQVVAELVALLRKSDRAKAGDVIESFLLASRAGAGTGRTTRRSARSLRACSPTGVSGADGCGWCSRRSRTTGGAGKTESRASARSGSHGEALPSST